MGYETVLSQGYIEATFNGKRYNIAEVEVKLNFDIEGNSYCIFGRKWDFFKGLFAKRHKNQFLCVFWDFDKTPACHTNQVAWSSVLQ